MQTIGQVRYQTMLLYSQSQVGGFRIWDLQTEYTAQLIPVNDLNIVYVTAPAWSPDGNMLAFVGRRTTTDNGLRVADNLYLSDATGRDVRLLFDTSGSPLKTSSQGTHTVTWSPDGTKIALYLDLYGAPQLWLITRDGTLLTHVTGQSPLEDSPGALPLDARILWSAASDAIYVVSVRNDIRYRTLAAQPDATLSTAQATTALAPSSIQLMSASPLAPHLLIATETDLAVLDLTTEQLTTLTSIAGSSLTALAWSDNGKRIGWITRGETTTRVHTYNLMTSSRISYNLPDHIQRDRSYQLWLPDDGQQVVVRMQRGELCRNIRHIKQPLRCFEPDVFSPTWHTLRP